MSYFQHWEKYSVQDGQYHLLPEDGPRELTPTLCGQQKMQNNGETKIPWAPTCRSCAEVYRKRRTR